MNVQAIDTTQKRLRILGDDEIAALYSRPCFTHDERTQYFSLSQPEKEVLQDLRSVTSQAYFVLQLGYFKARQLFFTFDLDEVAEDLQYVLEHHFPTCNGSISYAARRDNNAGRGRTWADNRVFCPPPRKGVAPH
jgi:hypothetical protein